MVAALMAVCAIDGDGSNFFFSFNSFAWAARSELPSHCGGNPALPRGVR